MSPSGFALERLAQEGEGLARARRCRPNPTGPRRRPSRAGRPAARAGSRRARRSARPAAAPRTSEGGPPPARAHPPPRAEVEQRASGPAGRAAAGATSGSLNAMPTSALCRDDRPAPGRPLAPPRPNRRRARAGRGSGCRVRRRPIRCTARRARRAGAASTAHRGPVGRAATGSAVPAPGAALRTGRAAVAPSASRPAPEPGVIVDSSTSKRSTAKRTVAPPPGPGTARRCARARRAEPDALGAGVVAALAAAPAEPLGRRRGGRRADAGHRVDARAARSRRRSTDVAPAVPAVRSGGRRRPGASTWTPVAPAGIASSTAVPGATAPAGPAQPPSSSPARLESRIGNATWRGRSEWRGSKARTAVASPARSPL